MSQNSTAHTDNTFAVFSEETVEATPASPTSGSDGKTLIEEVQEAKLNKGQGLKLAFQQALGEASLSGKEISELAGDYQYLIDERTGCPYNHVPVWLPRRRKVYDKEATLRAQRRAGRGAKVDKVYRDVPDPATFRVENCDTEFSRTQFYGNRRFQGALRAHYRKLGYPIKLIETRRGFLMKIFID
jgi:hypothetical protein